MAPCCRASLFKAATCDRIRRCHIDLLVRTSKDLINCAPISPTGPILPGLSTFLSDLIARTPQITPAVMLLAADYLTRLHTLLPRTARGLACTIHRIVLAALLVATKFLHDGPVRNCVWATNSRLFSLAELNLMERQLLFLLDFALAVDPLVLFRMVEGDRECAAAAISVSSVQASPVSSPTGSSTSLLARSAEIVEGPTRCASCGSPEDLPNISSTAVSIITTMTTTIPHRHPHPKRNSLSTVRIHPHLSVICRTPSSPQLCQSQATSMTSTTQSQHRALDSATLAAVRDSLTSSVAAAAKITAEMKKASIGDQHAPGKFAQAQS
ncbi:hypothetical protein HKX48_002504, partial [Thoreauomyces humboldtii]